MAAGKGIGRFSGDGVGANMDSECPGQVMWNVTGMRFTPPDVSYQPMSAPPLSAEGAFDYSGKVTAP